MTLRLEEVVIDCKDAQTLGHWWADALGWEIVDEEEGVEVRNPEGNELCVLGARE